jgi:hypothetical protein
MENAATFIVLSIFSPNESNQFQWDAEWKAGARMQLCITFPAPPLKFRTSGFPQYGFKLEFNCDLRWNMQGLSARPTCTMHYPTYTQLKLPPSAPMALLGMSRGES